MKFISNHNHTDKGSNLKMLDCICKVKPLIDHAIELGYKGLAITDHSSISSHVQAIQYVKELRSNGVDFVLGLGSEEYVIDDHIDIRENYVGGGQTKFWHLIFIAKDSIGYEQLRKIDSTAWDNSFMTGRMRRTPVDKQQIADIIGEDRGHLLVSTACLGSELAQHSLDYLNTDSMEYKNKIHSFIMWLIDTFGEENIALEIQPSYQEEQVQYNKFLLMLGDAYKIPVIITNDVHYLKKEDREVHEAFITSRDAEDREMGDFYATTYLMPLEEMWDYVKEYMERDVFEEIIENSYNFTKDVEQIDMEHTTIIPERDLSGTKFEVGHVFKDWYDRCQGIHKFAYSEYVQDKYLLYMIEQGFLEKNQEFNEENISRIDWEMNELWKVSEALNDRMSAYYNLVDYIVDLCWEIGFVGVSRGSVTGYYTMYLIDIHQLNPIKWNLPAYRHLNSSRISFPDIDLDTSARNRPKIIAKLKETFGADNILNICTFRTETSKSACKTACRGLGMTSDEGDFLASLVPVERGKQWSISDCFNGNKNKERKPISGFISEVRRLSADYEVNLKNIIEMIEGMVSGLSLHASGIYIFKDGYIKQNSKMKTPRGDEVTAWEMEDSDYAGGLKYDSLTTECQDKLEVCVLEYLVKHGKIKEQKSIRETYNKYLHPDVINYNNQDMWDKCSNGQIIDLFQFITPVGSSCIKKIKPHNLLEMANANSLMRISVRNGEQPIDKFLRYKLDTSLWYKELEEYKIMNPSEIKALEEILLPNYGVANTQEDIMELSMRPEISNFTLKDADKMRRIVAKKKSEDVEELKEKFYSSVEGNGNSIHVANYVWEQCITPQLAYSFSRNHVLPYSVEALQEMNLYHFYPSCYWNCAALAVNSGTADENGGKSTDYGKIAKAIYRSRNFGVPVESPSINESEISFTPNEKENTILFGLGAISGINQDIAQDIIDGRPYTSFEQFYQHHKNLSVCNGVDEDGQPLYRGTMVTKSKMIKLIQAGCFDSLESDRIALMKWLCVYENPQKQSLTMANVNKAINLGIELPADLVRAYRFKQYVVNKKYLIGVHPQFKSKKLYRLEDEFARPHFEQKYIHLLKEDVDYYNNEGALVVVDKSLEKAQKEEMDELKELLNDPEIVGSFNKKMLQEAYIDMIKVEDINKWSMESISFYNDGQHELKDIDYERYNLAHYSDLPEDPVFIERSSRGRTWKQYELYRICGTVLDRTDANHLVDVLTPDNEVINVKFTSGQYAHCKQTIEEDKNWLSRGSLLMLVGYRRGEDGFVVKNYKSSVYQHSVAKITKVNEDKTLELQLERLSKEQD